MKTYSQFLETNEKRTTYDYGCAMIYYKAPDLLELHKSINEEDIHENGLETEPHVTLLYGLHSDEIDDDKVMNLCSEGEYVPVEMGTVSVFENKDFDVLKFDVESPVLNAVNKKLTELPHTNNYPDYQPHATIAYLKPGLGKKYAKMLEGAMVYAIPEEIVYSKPDGSKIRKKIEKK